MATALLSGADPDEVLRAVPTRVADAHRRRHGRRAARPASTTTRRMTIVAAVGPRRRRRRGRPRAAGGHRTSAQPHRGRRPAAHRGHQHHAGGRPRAAAVVVELTAGYGPAHARRRWAARPTGACSRSCGAAGREPVRARRPRPARRRSPPRRRSSWSWPAAQQRERRLQVQADRDRIARDLHDHVVQRIFATALSLDRLSRVAGGRARPRRPRRLSAQRRRAATAPSPEIRTSIFELHAGRGRLRRAAVRRRLAEVVRSVTEGHDAAPATSGSHGAVDDLPARPRPRPRRGGARAGHQRRPARRAPSGSPSR